MKILLTACVWFAFCFGCVFTFAADEQYKTYENLVYRVINDKELHLDLYNPGSTDTLFPAVLFIHGGGWRGGDKTHFQKQAIHLAQQGYVTACIQYRLSGEAHFPAALEDARTAVRWLRANADQYQIDPSRIAVAGGSAGGHLAAMVALTPEDQYTGNDYADFSNEVALAICFNPVLDLNALKTSKMVTDFLGTTHELNPKIFSDASPMDHIHESSPPFLIFHGTADTTVPFTQAQRFRDALEEVSAEVMLIPEEGAQHAYFNNSPYFEETLKIMHAYLDEHFKTD